MFWFVALALIYRRYAPGLNIEMGVEDGDRQMTAPFRPMFFRNRLGPTGMRYLVSFWMILMVLSTIVFTVFFNAGHDGIDSQPFVLNLGGYNAEGTYTPVLPFWGALTHTARRSVLIIMTCVWGGATLGLQLTCPIEFVPPKWHLNFWVLPWLVRAAMQEV